MMHMEAEAVDEACVRWLQSHSRAGYVKAFLELRRDSPETLGWCDLEDLIAIFSPLPPQDDPTDDALAGLLAGLAVSR